MVTESHADGEAALLAEIRARFGDIPLAVSLDLHANMSPAFVGHADIVTIYRTYPHLDMAQTGSRAMQRLLRLIDGETLHYAFRQVPFLVPLNAQYTGANPCAHLYHSAANLPASHGEFAEIALGFTAADIPDCGPSVISPPAQARADAIADVLLAAFAEAEETFDTALLDPEDAVSRRCASGTGSSADVQDNPGAGGCVGSTGLLMSWF